MSSKKASLPDLSNVVEQTSIAAYLKRGKGDKKLADKAATQTMRKELNKSDRYIKVVIGEGERDEAPMLYIGEMLGRKGGKRVDIAVDPLENTNATANNLPNAVVLLAESEKDGLTHAPDIYMDKLGVGPKVKASLTVDDSATKIVSTVAKAYGIRKEDVVVALLERDRNDERVEEVRKTGAKVLLLADGDVCPPIAACFPDSGIHVGLGIGAAPEGVITAAAIKCLGGQFSGRFWFQDDGMLNSFKKINKSDPKKLYTADELASGKDIKVYISGVTEGYLVDGVSETDSHFETNTLIISSEEPTVRKVTSRYYK